MRRQSHGHIRGYEVTLWNPEESLRHTEIVPPDTYSIPVNLTQMTSFSRNATVIATVFAKNVEGMSQPASVPLIMRGMWKWTEGVCGIFSIHEGFVTCY